MNGDAVSAIHLLRLEVITAIRTLLLEIAIRLVFVVVRSGPPKRWSDVERLRDG